MRQKPVRRVSIIAAIIGATMLSADNVSAEQVKLMLFGGTGHDVYLGCLNCPSDSRESIFNRSGAFGKRYGETIWAPVSDYGSVTSDYSPWCITADDPPVIVDEDGNFYGRFTVNRIHQQKTKIDWIRDILECGRHCDNETTPSSVPSVNLAPRSAPAYRPRANTPKHDDDEATAGQQIAGPFLGFDGSTQFMLTNGQIWEEYEPYNFLSTTDCDLMNPSVTFADASYIAPGVYLVKIGGDAASALVTRIR